MSVNYKKYVGFDTFAMNIINYGFMGCHPKSHKPIITKMLLYNGTRN